MSWKVQALVGDRVCGSMARKMILLNMAARANDDGSGVYASIPTMAAWCEMDARSARRVVRDLEDSGLIRLVGHRDCKNGYVNEWAICIDVVATLLTVKDELEEQRRNKALAKRTPDCMPGRTVGPGGRDVRADAPPGRTVGHLTPDRMPAKSIQETTPPSSLPSEAQKPPQGGECEEVPKEEATKPDSDRGSRLPDDWALDAELVAYAVEHGYTEHEAEFINHRFENHWRAATGRASRKKDWRRTFQNWVTNEKRWQVRDGAKAWRKATSAGGEDWTGFLAIWRDNGTWPARLGPAPNQPGYRGPAIPTEPDLLSQGGQR